MGWCSTFLKTPEPILLAGDFDMRENVSCKNLTYPYAPFNGCTVNELIVLGLIIVVVDLSIAGFLMLFGLSFFLSTLILTLLSASTFKVWSRQIGRLKKGKQHGYIFIKMRLILNQKFGVKLPYINRAGVWATRRSK